MLAAANTPCDPAALASAVRILAREARLAFKGPHTEASLAELAHRAKALPSDRARAAAVEGMSRPISIALTPARERPARWDNSSCDQPRRERRSRSVVCKEWLDTMVSIGAMIVAKSPNEV